MKMRQKLVFSRDTGTSSCIMGDKEHSIFIQLKIQAKEF